MKVLLPIIYHRLTECIARAFREEGHRVKVVDWRALDKSQVEDRCIAEAKAFKPDLCFAQFQAPGLISQRFPQVLKDIGCFSINWSGDVRHPLPSWYKDVAPYFDVMSFTNQTDVDTIRAMGHRSEFLQIGYEERLYNTRGAAQREGVVFIGNNYQKFPESQGRREVVLAMEKEFKKQFTVYGLNWEGVANGSAGGYAPEPSDAAIYRRSLVAIGWDHFHRPGFASDRLLRATACGCATINQHYDGIEQEHPEVAPVRSIDQMIQAVRHALKYPVESQMIGGLSAHNTLKKHRWNQRVKTIETWMK